MLVEVCKHIKIIDSKHPCVILSLSFAVIFHAHIYVVKPGIRLRILSGSKYQ